MGLTPYHVTVKLHTNVSLIYRKRIIYFDVRPVSNINFLSKIIEKCVVKQLEEFMHNNNLFDPFQSAYRSQHATETAMLKINNDILSGLDRDKCTVLASLDLSAAFDTVDYAIFLRRLQNLYGVE